jgi:hypothetical protein
MTEALEVSETERFAVIGKRLIEIESQLFAPCEYTRSNVLAADAERLNREHEEFIAALSLERVELLGQLPPIGMASGQRLVLASTLGTVCLRDSEPEPEVTIPVDEWDWSEE